MSTHAKGLTRGARATFYRDGHEIVQACDIPVAGAFVVRDLAPGQYVVRDSCGGEQAFSVQVSSESTTILNGDTVGPTGGPGQSGVVATATRMVGPGGGSITTPDQVADGRNTTDRVRLSEGEMPHEKAASLAKAERPSERPGDPTSAERVPGQAGAAFALDVPIRSVAETTAEAERRGKLSEEERREEQEAAADAAVLNDVDTVIAPAEVGPEPDRSTLVSEREGASSPKTPTPLEGRRLQDPQPPLGAVPVDED